MTDNKATGCAYCGAALTAGHKCSVLHNIGKHTQEPLLLYTSADLAAAESAAYKRGVEAGRKERTVEIAGKCYEFDPQCWPRGIAQHEIKLHYPKCFEEAEKP